MTMKYISKKITPFIVEVFGNIPDDSLLRSYLITLYRRKGYAYVKDSFRVLRSNIRNVQRILLVGKFVYVGRKGIDNFPFDGISVSGNHTMIPVMSTSS